jgi:glycosyltransferase involved in cell wall biosynthesis
MVDDAKSGAVDVALCIDLEAYNRLWEVIQHLCVGLVDLPARVRLISSCPQVESISLGPIQTVWHQPITWPVRRKRLQQVVDVLSAKPPNVITAISNGSFRTASAIAAALDIELVLYVTSTADTDALNELEAVRSRTIVAASEPLAERLARLGYANEAEVELVRPGVLRAEQISSFVDPNRTPTLLCTTSLEENRGVDELIRAIRILRNRGFELLAFLTGQGRREDALRQLVNRLEVRPWVTFAQPKAEASQVIAGADLFVRPSPELAITFRTLLAMATGTAVVTCAGGVTDHCHDGQTAIVCPERTPEALADGIERLLRDKDFARRIAAAGMEYIKSHHQVSAMAENMMEIFQRLILRHKTFQIKR